jgi:hypothetical protein
VGVTFPYDYNRDTTVSTFDQLTARNSRTTFATALNLINLSSGGQSLMTGDGSESQIDGGGSESLLEDGPTIIVGNHTLLPNTAGQTIQIYVSGGQMVDGIDIDMQLGDGGPELTQLGLTAGTDGPAITNIDSVTGTIFASSSNAASFYSMLPQLASNYTAIVSANGYVAADGLLMTVTIDTTGFTTGTWDLLLSGVLPFIEFGGGHATTFDGLPIDITNGTITIGEGEGMMAASGGESLAQDGSDVVSIPAIALAVEQVTIGMQHGVRLDVGRIGNAAGLDPSDFVFRAIDGDDPTDIVTLNPSDVASVSVELGTGLNGSDQITLVLSEALSDYDALEITLKAGADTGLASDDVFDFAIAELFA